jgi:hypothetical protein
MKNIQGFSFEGFIDEGANAFGTLFIPTRKLVPSFKTDINVAI